MVAGGVQMTGEDLGRGRHGVRPALLEHPCDARVQRAARGAHERCVGRIADESVLEDVARGGVATAHVQKLGVHQARKSFVEGTLVELSDFLQQLAVETPPEDRADLGDDARGAEPIQAREEQVVQRVGHGRTAAQVRELPAGVRPPQRAGVA